VARKLATNGYFYIYHRFHNNTLEFVRKMKGENLISSISIGVNSDAYTLIQTLKAENCIPDYITIDIAHGHSEKMESILAFLVAEFPDPETRPYIIAGNVSTPEAVEDLDDWGADCVKVGIGPGCFTADTRVLMANGIYKNINDVEVGDFVINQDGNPVSVKNKFNMGIRPVMKLKNNLHYKYTYCTPDHNFFVGDLSSSSLKTIKTRGIAKLLDKQNKTTPKTTKYKWKEVGQCNWDNTVALLPKYINWKLNDNFSIDMINYVNRNKGYDDKYIQTVGGNTVNKIIRVINSSYNLGYIFGTFLGDGHSRIYLNNNKH
jgi:hypothetical protein